MKLIILTAFIVNIYATPFEGERIVGGQIAYEGVFPYQASLKLWGVHLCGSSIIGSKTILTAAHCLDGLDIKGMTVVVGTLYNNKSGDSYITVQYAVHDDYDSSTKQHDIGIVKLAYPIRYNANVQPISLNMDWIPDHTFLIATGWGQTTHPGYPSNELRMLRVPTFNLNRCSRTFYPDRPIYSTQICTYLREGQGMCHGDSGGPLAYNDKLVGVLSWVYPCAKGYPDVFTRVSSYIEWIQQHLD